MVNVFEPGYPIVFSNWLGSPSGVVTSMTDAKAIDAQYGIEKALISLAAGLDGGNLVYEFSGMTASLLGLRQIALHRTRAELLALAGRSQFAGGSR